MGDVYGHLYSGNTPSRKNSTNFGGDTPWIRTADLNNGLIKSATEFLTYEGIKQLKILPENTIVLAMYGGFNQIGRTGILGFPATINQALVALTPQKNINQVFAQSYLNRHIIDWRRVAASSRKDPNITKEDVEKSDFSFGSLEEQNRISKLISRLDHTITLHEEKKRQLERLKSALLQKIFADKSGYPAVRFKGFDEMWKQSKFGEITQKYKIRNKQGRILKSFSVSNSNGFVPQELQFENGGYALNADKTNSIIVKPNSFAYNPARINVGSIGYYNGDKDILVSSLYEVFTLREGFDSKYMWYWIKSNNFDRWIYRLQEGSVRSYFYYDKFSEIKELLPSLDEQKKIGQLLSKLDSVIYIHDRALLLLNMIKQSLLQKMFI